MGKIKLLSDEIINQIAAGEIVERPCSALKEVVENSIDASAKNIDIFIKNGGKTKIIVEDDGDGISKEDLEMCIKRHATSKLPGSNLFDINSYGFRGEAIPSIASVSKLSIESGNFGISVNFSEISEIFPSAVSKGTKISIENLFDMTPVRLKFLKSDTSELSSCLSVIENFALTKPNINFSVQMEEKSLISFKNDNIESRISKIFGEELFKNAIYFDESDETIRAYGYLFHPMNSKYSQMFQKIFINNRVVKDRFVSAAIKNAYRDLIPSGRYPAALIFIEINPFYIDINVSPTKSEIRFRDTAYVQKMLTTSFKKHITTFDRVTLDFDTSYIKKTESYQKEANISPQVEQKDEKIILDFLLNNKNEKQSFFENKNSFARETVVKTFEEIKPTQNLKTEIIEQPEEVVISKILEESNKNFFGEPVCQLFNSYIISQNGENIFIIDQHAVHEKITQDSMIKKLNCENKQFLLKPEIVELSDNQIISLKKIIESIKTYGFNFEVVQNSLIISAIPNVLNPNQAVMLIKDLIESYEEIDLPTVLDLIKNKIADIACHNSIRAGRKLSTQDMKAILEQMENTESIHQCNHHRPSFIAMTKESLDKMFERK